MSTVVGGVLLVWSGAVVTIRHGTDMPSGDALSRSAASRRRRGSGLYRANSRSRVVSWGFATVVTRLGDIR